MGASAHEFVIAQLPELLPRLWRYGLVLARDRDLAEDIVQMTCLRAIERASQFTPGTRLDRWLFAILRSVWLNELRARRVRLGQGLVDPEEVLVFDGERLAETNILASQVLREVLALPEAQRETVLLVYVEGFTYREAAEVLGIPIGTVMSRLAAVRRKLGELNAKTASAAAEKNETTR
jgi:RNA polymerase sigma-70 factor (ECF subfamily)